MAQLAINGGTPVRKEDFHPWPVFNRGEEEAVLEVLRSGNWWRYSFGEEIGLSERDQNGRSHVAIFRVGRVAHGRRRSRISFDPQRFNADVEIPPSRCPQDQIAIGDDILGSLIPKADDRTVDHGDVCQTAE